MSKTVRLGVNIDHVATIRNARGGAFPCPIEAAKLAEKAGASGITAHLREDRRHIKDADMLRLKNEVNLPLNFEMAATEEMLKIALQIKPNAVCLVPEKREELTTEGGLDVLNLRLKLHKFVTDLKTAGIRVSLFIDAEHKQVESAAEIGADIIELHTGAYAHEKEGELARIRNAAALAEKLGLEVHAGHGLNYDNVAAIAAIPQIVELNIGHFLIGQAVFIGLEDAIKKMRQLMNNART